MILEIEARAVAAADTRAASFVGLVEHAMLLNAGCRDRITPAARRPKRPIP